MVSVSSTPPHAPSPSLPPTNLFLVQAQKLILPLTFKNYIAPKDHLVNQAHQMLAEGTSLVSVKEIISKLAVPIPLPLTPTQQHKLDAAKEKGHKIYTVFILCKR